MATRKVAMDALGIACPTSVLGRALGSARRHSGYHADVRVWAAQVLAKQGTPSAVDALRQGLREPWESLRLATTEDVIIEVAVRRALASIGESAAFTNLPVYEAHAGSRSEQVWLGLREFAVPSLISEASGAGGDRNAVRILGRLGDPRAIAPLVLLARSDLEAMRKAAVQALDALGWKPTTPGDRALIAVERGHIDQAVDEGPEALESLIRSYNTVFDNGERDVIGSAITQLCGSDRSLLMRAFAGISRPSYAGTTRAQIAQSLCSCDDVDVIDFFAGALDHGPGSEQAGDCLSLLISRKATSLSVATLDRLVTRIVAAISKRPCGPEAYDTGKAARSPLVRLLKARAGSLTTEALQRLVAIADPIFVDSNVPGPEPDKHRVDLSMVRALAEEELQARRGTA